MYFCGSLVMLCIPVPSHASSMPASLVILWECSERFRQAGDNGQWLEFMKWLELHSVTFIFLLGHTGVSDNKYADRLANVLPLQAVELWTRQIS